MKHRRSPARATREDFEEVALGLVCAWAGGGVTREALLRGVPKAALAAELTGWLVLEMVDEGRSAGTLLFLSEGRGEHQVEGRAGGEVRMRTEDTVTLNRLYRLLVDVDFVEELGLTDELKAEVRRLSGV